MIYRLIIRKVLFALKPEHSHDFVFNFLKILFYIPGVYSLISLIYRVENKNLNTNVFGLSFKNPVGLAAGFDKNAKVFNEFSAFGFGFIEIGTVTPIPQSGNEKPRVFRLKEDNALVNRMGFNNDGVECVVERLKKKYTDIIIGGNIGKNKITPNELANSDYISCLKKISPYVDYLVLNISSPNTPGLTELQNKKYLSKLLSDVQSSNKKNHDKPILIKISCDLNNQQIDDIINLVEKYKISGIIATNTSSKRENLKSDSEIVGNLGIGGLSGQPIKQKSMRIISYIKSKKKNLPIIAVGGIMDSNDAIDFLRAGASLVQIYTGFIYTGPSLVKSINKKILSS